MLKLHDLWDASHRGNRMKVIVTGVHLDACCRRRLGRIARAGQLLAGGRWRPPSNARSHRRRCATPPLGRRASPQLRWRWSRSMNLDTRMPACLQRFDHWAR